MAFRKAILSNSAAPTSAVALLCFAASVAVVGAMLSAVVFAQLF
jgi:hypothetical protein